MQTNAAKGNRTPACVPVGSHYPPYVENPKWGNSKTHEQIRIL